MEENSIKSTIKRNNKDIAIWVFFHLPCSAEIGKLAARFTRALHDAGKIFGPHTTGVTFR